MLFSSLLSFGIFASLGAAVHLNVAATGGNASSPMKYGIMFEDISHSGDGGIYAELIQNRAFQGTNSHAPWKPIGATTLSVVTTNPISASLPNSLLVQSSSGSLVGIENPWWWGIEVKHQTYIGSFWALGVHNSNFTVTLQSASTGEVWASATFNGFNNGKAWTEYTFTLTPKVAAPDTNNTFTIQWTLGSSLQFQMISLFPPTYNHR
jgi:alpha-N-arabinofuranosidase